MDTELAALKHSNLGSDPKPKVKSVLHEIYGAPSREEAQAAFDNTLTRFGDKYSKAMDCLRKDRDELLAF